jgi:hypothetical protein
MTLREEYESKTNQPASVTFEERGIVLTEYYEGYVNWLIEEVIRLRRQPTPPPQGEISNAK